MARTTRKPIRIEIRIGAYALYVRGDGYSLFVHEAYRGSFDTLLQATEYADRLLTEQVRRAA